MHAHPVVLLVSSDPQLTSQLEHLLPALHLSLVVVPDSSRLSSALEDATRSLPECTQGLLLLDSRLPEVANSRLLAELSESPTRLDWGLALIATEVSDEWIARLREGIIDDIVPREADIPTWKTHLSLIQRGHTLFCELEELRESTLQQVQHDALTGVLDRDTLVTTLFRETDRIQRQQGSLALIGIDLDNLHRINEEHGREAGDQLLRETARRVSHLLRSYDSLGRLDDDEFLLILPGCSQINALLLAERLRTEVFGEPFWIRRAPNRTLKPNGINGPSTSKGEVVQIHLSASYGIVLSHGRSPVVVIREIEQLLSQASHLQNGTILRPGDLAAPSHNPRLSPAGSGSHAFEEMEADAIPA